MTTRAETLAVLKQAKYDLSVIQTRIGEAIRAVAALPLDEHDERPTCVPCGLRFKGPRSLAEHVYVHHDGPVPAHYLEAERRAGIWQSPELLDILVAPPSPEVFDSRAHTPPVGSTTRESEV